MVSLGTAKHFLGDAFASEMSGEPFLCSAGAEVIASGPFESRVCSCALVLVSVPGGEVYSCTDRNGEDGGCRSHEAQLI